VVARVRWRLERLGLAGVTVTDEDADPLAHESQALAGLSEAAVLGRAALGRRAGRGPLRIGADPDAPWVERDDRPRHRAALPVPVPPAARAAALAAAARRADRRGPSAALGRRDDTSRVHARRAPGASRAVGAAPADQLTPLSRSPGAERAVAPGGGGARRGGEHGSPSQRRPVRDAGRGSRV